MELISEDGVQGTIFDVKKNLLPELTDGLVGEDHVKVFLRIRPFNAAELSKKENHQFPHDFIKVESDKSLLVQNPQTSIRDINKNQQRFTFSRIFNDDTKQKSLFHDAVLPTLKDFINGQNCLLFSYGVSNSGKTHTIYGEADDRGILPRSLEVIFNSISGCQYFKSDLKPDSFCDITRLNVTQQQAEHDLKQSILSMSLNFTKEDSFSKTSTILSGNKDEVSVHSYVASEDEDNVATVVADRVCDLTSVDINSQGNVRFAIWVSFAEIYNEQIFDLLVPLPGKKLTRRPMLQMREDRLGRPYIKGLREVQVASVEEADRVLFVGRKNLHFASTKLNQTSSRSHCVFTVKMVRVVNKENPHVAHVSMLSFCDLAGSERVHKTQGLGVRLKEAGNINSSLLTLGRCLTILRRNQSNRISQPQVVPFRESKLTRLFQSFFTGKGRISMIVNISRCLNVFDETLFAIKYSAIAQQIVVSQAAKLVVEEEPESKMEVHQKNNHSANRDTIAWASPGTYQRLIEDGQLSVSLGLTSVSNSSLISQTCSESEENDDADETRASISLTGGDNAERVSWQKEQSELHDVIQVLKNKLIEVHQNSVMAESRIREEVCNEMKIQLVLIENNNQENLRVYKEIIEEKYEKKLVIIKEAMENSRKRQRTDDEFPDHELLTERVNELEQENKELIGFRDLVQMVSQERDQAVQKSTELQFSLANVNSELKKVTIELEKKDEELIQLREYLKVAARDRDQAVEQSAICSTIEQKKMNEELIELRKQLKAVCFERDQIAKQSTNLQSSLNELRQELNIVKQSLEQKDVKVIHEHLKVEKYDSIDLLSTELPLSLKSDHDSGNEKELQKKNQDLIDLNIPLAFVIPERLQEMKQSTETEVSSSGHQKEPNVTTKENVLKILGVTKRQHAAEDISLQKTTTSKRRRKLMNKVDEPLMATPVDIAGDEGNLTMDPHQIVRRRLRERQLRAT